MRFKEIISTQRIVDTKTNIEYYGLIDDGLFEEINNIAEENEQLKQREKILLAEIDDFQDLLKQVDDKIDYAVSVVDEFCPEQFACEFKKTMEKFK